ncbi:MAG: hypothetical protein IPJ13_17140 [Saprospiraceae bacterium]|nr:hypothetical protein [Saprospiraceae bacterium]
MQNEFKRDDLTFVSISIDENKAAWQNMVKRKGMKAYNYFLKMHGHLLWFHRI